MEIHTVGGNMNQETVLDEKLEVARRECREKWCRLRPNLPIMVASWAALVAFWWGLYAMYALFKTAIAN